MSEPIDDAMEDDDSDLDESDHVALARVAVKVQKYLKKLSEFDETLNMEQMSQLPPVEMYSQYAKVYNADMEEKILDTMLPVVLMDIPYDMTDMISTLFFTVRDCHVFTIVFHIRFVKMLKSQLPLFGLVTKVNNEVEESQSMLILFDMVDYIITKMKHVATEMNLRNNDVSEHYPIFLFHCIELLDYVFSSVEQNSFLIERLEHNLKELIDTSYILLKLRVTESVIQPGHYINESISVLLETLSCIEFVTRQVFTDVSGMIKENQKDYSTIQCTCFLIGAFKLTHFEKYLFEQSHSPNEFIRCVSVWSLAQISPTDLRDKYFDILKRNLLIEQGHLKLITIKSLNRYFEKDELDGLEQQACEILPVLYESIQSDLKEKKMYALTVSWSLIAVIIGKFNRIFSFHIIEKLFLQLEDSMTAQSAHGFDKVDINFKKVHSLFYTRVLSRRGILNSVLKPRIMESVFVSLKRVLFQKYNPQDSEYLNNYIEFLANAMDQDYMNYILKHQRVVLSSLMKHKMLRQTANHSYYCFVMQVGKHLRHVLSVDEIISSLVIENLIERMSQLMRSKDKLDDVFLLLVIVYATSELLREYGRLVEGNLPLKEKLFNVLETKVVANIDKNLRILDFSDNIRSSNETVTMYIMVKSAFCAIISVIYCYCSPDLILSSFRHFKETFLHFSELPQLRLSTEQLEYFTTFVGILEYVTDVENTSTDISFLQNQLLLELSIAILRRIKKSIDTFNFRAEFNAKDEGEELTVAWKHLLIKAKRLEIILETQVRDLENA